MFISRSLPFAGFSGFRMRVGKQERSFRPDSAYLTASSDYIIKRYRSGCCLESLDDLHKIISAKWNARSMQPAGTKMVSPLDRGSDIYYILKELDLRKVWPINALVELKTEIEPSSCCSRRRLIATTLTTVVS